MKISVVIPVYGCPAAVDPLTTRLRDTILKLTDDYEIVLVNDSCPKNSWDEILKACQKDEHIVGINLSRNFGQIKAITAGLDNCDGDWIVVMDCDLQDRPEGIIDLYNKAMEGYDVVFAKRFQRKDNAITKFFSKAFYKVYDYLTDGTYDNSICNFCICKKAVIDKYCEMREQNRAFTLFLKWLGFKQTAIDVEADVRFEGKSSYNFSKKINLALEFITAQSNKPLKLFVKLGFWIAFLSFLWTIVRIVIYFITGNVPLGWTSLMVLVCFFSGVLLISNGIIGMYIGYVFNETKHRPLYVIRDIETKHPVIKEKANSEEK